MKTLVARIDTYTKAGRFVPRGGAIREDEIDFVEGKSDNVVEVEGAEQRVAIEMSAIAPTGPNPRNPQQIASDTEQTTEGYVQSGALVVGEVTEPEKVRRAVIVDVDDTTQGDVVEAIEEANRKAASDRADRDDRANRADRDDDTAANDDDDLVSGTVAEVTARIDGADDAELERLRAAEEDREKPRAGVLSAIDREQASR